MDLTGKIVARGPEAFTVRELREMTDSRAWKVYSERLNAMYHGYMQSCVTGKDADAWRKAQGAAEALDRVQQIPAILEQEMTGKKD